MAPSGSTPATARTPLESLLLRDRWLIGTSLAVAIVLCWAWIVPMAHDMYGAMDGPSAWMMTDTWDFPHLALLFAMWAVMMAGMMLPSAAPTVLLYAGVIRKSPGAERVQAHVYAFAGGYLVIWTAFSLAATVLQRLLAHALLLSPMMEIRARWFASALLIVAGIYQLTHSPQTHLPSILPVARGLHRATLAVRRERRLPNRRGARIVLPGLLLGLDAAPVRRRRDEPLVDCRPDHFRPAGKDRAARRPRRPAVGLADYRLRPVQSRAKHLALTPLNRARNWLPSGLN